MEHDPDIWNTRGQFNKTFTTVVFKCRSLLSEFKTMTPVTANDFSTPLALRFIRVQLLQWDIFQFMKIPLQLSPTKNCNFLQRSSETTNPYKYTEKKAISDNLTGKSRWECVPVIFKLKYSRTSPNCHLSTTATFFGVQPIHWLSFTPLYNGHTLTAATSFCTKGDRCGEVQQQRYSLPVVCVFCNYVVGPVLCDNTESVFFNAIVDNASMKRYIQVTTVISLHVF